MTWYDTHKLASHLDKFVTSLNTPVSDVKSMARRKTGKERREQLRDEE